MNARLVDVLNYAAAKETMKNFNNMMITLHETLDELKQIPNVEVGLEIRDKTFIAKYLDKQKLFVFNTDDKGVTWCISEDKEYKSTGLNTVFRNKLYSSFEQKNLKQSITSGCFSLTFTAMLSLAGSDKRINEFFEVKGGFSQPDHINHHFYYDVLMNAIRARNENRNELNDAFPYMVGKSKSFLMYNIYNISNAGFTLEVSGAGMECTMKWNNKFPFPCNSNMREFLNNQPNKEKLRQ